MAKIILNDVGSGQSITSAAATINANNAVLEAAFENTLSRDGTAPNQIAHDIDMNSYRILNLPLPIDDTEPARLIDVRDGITGPAGPAATITVGNTTTLPPGSPATVVNVGTSSAAIFDLGIPRGADGAGTGDFSTNTATSVDSEVVVFSGTTGKLGKRATGTGLAKLTSGVLGTATASVDYLVPPSGTAILKANSGGALANAVANTDYLAPPSGSALLKANAGGALANAVSGTDYAPATSGSSILKGSSGGTAAATGQDVVTLGAMTQDIELVIDGGGSVITTGVKADIEIPFACTVQRATLLADQTGSIVVDVFKCTYAQYDGGSTHPVSGDKITASAPPTISAATKSQDSTLTGWTTSISAGDILRFNVNSASTVTRCTIALKVLRTGQ